MGNARFAYDKDSQRDQPIADGESIVVLLDSLYLGAFDEPGKGEILLSFSFATFPRNAAELEPDTLLREIGLPRVKNRTEADWLRGVVLFGPAPVHRSLAVTASVIEIDRGDAAARRVDVISGFASRLGSLSETTLGARRFGVLGSFLTLVNSLNADDLVLQESESFLTTPLEDVPTLRAGRILVHNGHPDSHDRTRLALSVRRVSTEARARRSAHVVGSAVFASRRRAGRR